MTGEVADFFLGWHTPDTLCTTSDHHSTTPHSAFRSLKIPSAIRSVKGWLGLHSFPVDFPHPSLSCHSIPSTTSKDNPFPHILNSRSNINLRSLSAVLSNTVRPDHLPPLHLVRYLSSTSSTLQPRAAFIVLNKGMLLRVCICLRLFLDQWARQFLYTKIR